MSDRPKYGTFTSSPSSTVWEVLAWSYAYLAMAQAAVEEGAARYGPKHYAIRTRMHKGLLSGAFEVGSVADDERLKMTLPQCCCYCGTPEGLSIDHLIPRSKGGPDHGENLVWACRTCNSSKHNADLLVWFERRGEFPPLMLLRRHLKLVLGHCRDRGLLGTPVESLGDVPFSVSSIPTRYPAPSTLRLWVTLRPPPGSADAIEPVASRADR